MQTSRDFHVIASLLLYQGWQTTAPWLAAGFGKLNNCWCAAMLVHVHLVCGDFRATTGELNHRSRGPKALWRWTCSPVQTQEIVPGQGQQQKHPCVPHSPSYLCSIQSWESPSSHIWDPQAHPGWQVALFPPIPGNCQTCQPTS